MSNESFSKNCFDTPKTLQEFAIAMKDTNISNLNDAILLINLNTAKM